VAQVLVAGGAGGVGEGIVRSLLTAGHCAIVPSRNPEKLDVLRTRLKDVEHVGSLMTLVGHIGETAGAERIRDRVIEEFGALDAVVASLGGWWNGGQLLDMSVGDWDAVMNEMLRTHFVFARTFIPVLQQQRGGRYVGIGGGAAYFPILESAPVCIAAAAQLMMTRTLHAEVTDRGVDILELVVDAPVRTRDSESVAQADWITADEVGAVVLDLVSQGRTDAPATTTSGPIVRMRPARAEVRHGL
jgi:NAD(P)-dependent dehydrogenase (short-subunit alcohol dehydrogenase family)